MSYIVSINGSDGSGKTTQIDLLKQNSNKSTLFSPDIAQYGVFPKLPERQAQKLSKKLYKKIERYRSNNKQYYV